MISYNHMIGLPVLLLEQGMKAGIVKEAYLEKKREYIECFSITYGNKRERYIKFADAQILKDKLLVDKDELIENDLSKVSTSKDLIEGKEIINKIIFDYQGESQGNISDIYFDPKTASLEAFQITDGIFEDLMNGRKVIPILNNVSFKEDGIFIGRDSIEEAKDSKKGLNKIFSKKENNIE